MYVIYKHTLIADCPHKGWSYIGLTKQKVQKRWNYGNGYSADHHKVFAAAIKKYGWNNFEHIILEDNIDTLEAANEREKYWIAYYHTWVKDTNCMGYNITQGGDGQAGRIPSTETREKMRQKKLGRKNGPHSETWKQHISAGHNIPVLCVETDIIYPSAKQAQQETGILATSINNCLKGRTKTAGKFHWKFVKNS